MKYHSTPTNPSKMILADLTNLMKDHLPVLYRKRGKRVRVCVCASIHHGILAYKNNFR